MRRVFREPLLHFLLLGLGLFVLHRWVAGSPGDSGHTITLTRGRIEQLVAGYERTNRRAQEAPEPEEMNEGAVRGEGP